MRKLHFVTALTLLAPMAVAGQAPAGNTPAPKPDEVTVIGRQPPNTKLVCETFVHTGSVKRKKICKTQAEFDAVHDQSLIEFQRRDDRQLRYRQMRQSCQIAGRC